MNIWWIILPVVIILVTVIVYFMRLMYKFGTRSIMWQREIKKFRMENEKNPVTDVIVFTGSSSIRRWDNLKKDMEPLEVINRGFGGGRIFEVTNYMEDLLLPHNPKGIVFYAGENDLSDFFWVKAPSTPDIVYQDFIEFHQKTTTQFPEIPIFFISIKPPKSRIKNWEAMQKANKKIFDYSQEQDNLHYIDVVDPMTDANGMILDGISVWDGIHMNEKGYAIWTETIKPILLQFFG